MQIQIKDDNDDIFITATERMNKLRELSVWLTLHTHY